MVNKDNYNPQEKTAEILARGYELVSSVPYRVSGRWVFYQLLQEGFYKSKDDYKHKWGPAVSRARHANYQQWRPDTLTDETREAIYRGQGSTTGKDWLLALADRLTCSLDKWHSQAYYVELWYEARAMTEQFRFYTQHITLRPMGGQPSIDYKYQCAQEISHAAKIYGKPVIVVYFGDYDSGGEIIRETILADVEKWCDVPFTFSHAGLTAEQAQYYNVPENPEKPGQYQWEALSDSAANEIITSAIAQYLDTAAFDETTEKEKHVSEWIREKITQLMDEYVA